MIKVYENQIDAGLMETVLWAVNEMPFQYGWPSNTDVPFGHWNADITHTSKNNAVDVSGQLSHPFDALWQMLNKEVFNNEAILTRCYANKQTFGTEGYIHKDTERAEDYTCLVYLNEYWDAMWGGETTFYNEDLTEITKAVLPSFGKLVVFNGNVSHCARGVTRICPVDRTTLMFKCSVDPSAVYEAEEALKEFLTSIGAHEKPHKNGSLRDHLMRTFYMMKDAGADDILALAGGLHSVYGTNAFKNPCLEYDDQRVRDTFGPQVDYLVRKFSKINRPHVLENPDGTLSEMEVFFLRCIECANLHDQGELTPAVYPNLYAFAQSLRNRKG